MTLEVEAQKLNLDHQGSPKGSYANSKINFLRYHQFSSDYHFYIPPGMFQFLHLHTLLMLILLLLLLWPS